MQLYMPGLGMAAGASSHGATPLYLGWEQALRHVAVKASNAMLEHAGTSCLMRRFRKILRDEHFLLQD